MRLKQKRFGMAVATGFASIVFLVGGLVGALVSWHLLVNAPPGSVSAALLSGLSILAPLIILLLSGAVWGGTVARLTGKTRGRQMALAGALGWGLSALLAGIALRVLELMTLASPPAGLPIQVLFALSFTPASFLVAGTGGFALGLAQHDARSAWRLALGSAVAGAAGFLVVSVLMQALGWGIGAPGAAEHISVLVLGIAGSIGAAGLAGGMIGWQL